jgi:DAACS family dicarboxylate/amino acid:cation (Na+ or H+) symporter
MADNKYEENLTTDLDDQTPDKPKGIALHTKVLIGLAVGVIGGVLCNQILGGDNKNLVWFIDNFTQPVGQLFLSLLLMIVVPLVFSSLVVGVSGIGDIRKLGRIGLKSFGYCLIISAISVVIGLTLANTIQPGKKISEETATKMKERFSGDASKRVEAQKKDADAAKQDTPLASFVKTIVPKNVFNSISGENPNMLHIMFFALIIGVAITLLPSTVSAPFVNVMGSLFEITSKIIDIIMKFAPYAVACLIFTNMARFGIELLGALGWFVATVLLALSLHMFGVYSLSVYFLSKMNPIEFFQAHPNRDFDSVFD